MTSFNWACPYCDHKQAVTSAQHTLDEHAIKNPESIYGDIGARIETIRCANQECKKLQLSLSLHRRGDTGPPLYHFVLLDEAIHSWRLLPESSARPQPDYIPPQIVEDYTEACRICDLSPKASATLSRRCLQGMIRDFCKISESSLWKEIETLKQQLKAGNGPRHVLDDTVEAIDHVRSIGNIGAHMEKDVNVLITVHPDEASKMIELIEYLFREWYVQREYRKQSFNDLSQIADKKKKEKQGQTAA